MTNKFLLPFSRLFAALFILLIFSACQGSDSPVDLESVPQESRLSEKERRELVPNSLFSAVLNNQLKTAQDILAQNPELVKSVNAAEGETPLGMSLRLEKQEIARLLVDATDLKDLSFQNKRKESYVFLAARAGFASIIRQIADRKYASLGTLRLKYYVVPVPDRFDFTELDQPDELGRTALFVARDRNTAMALGEQFYRGTAMMPWWSFFQHEDAQNRTFLHWAAVDNRQDVIAWAVEGLCSNEKAPDESWFGLAKRYATYGIDFVQFQTGDLGMPFDLIINEQDDLNRTALHYAADRLSLEAIQALQSCGLTNPYPQDKDGNTFLHLYLAALEKRNAQLPESQIKALAPMSGRKAWAQFYTKDPYSLLDVANHEGRTPAHLAALLADPRPFDILQSLRPVILLDKQGLTPAVLRAQTAAHLSGMTTQ